MRVTFTKSPTGGIGWDARRSDHTKVSLPPGAPQRGLPHDLVHYVVEAEFGLEHGFWGCIAAGGSLRTTRASHRKGRRPGGRGLLRKHSVELVEAESAIGEAVAAWQRGDATPVTRALESMKARWAAVPSGGTLRLDWPPTTERRRVRSS